MTDWLTGWLSVLCLTFTHVTFAILTDFGASCLAVVVVTSLISTTQVDGSDVSRTSPRWLYPCAGGEPALDVPEGFGDDVTRPPGPLFGLRAVKRAVDSVDWYRTYNKLVEVTMKLKRIVQELKTLYVSCCQWLSTLESIFGDQIAQMSHCQRGDYLFAKHGESLHIRHPPSLRFPFLHCLSSLLPSSSRSKPS